MIPKIIHYCWLSTDPVPAEFQKYIETWHKLMPDYEYIKWDFSQFDINSSKWVKDAFENKKYAFAADYIRLYALYHFGGFYLDMDVEVLKPFDPFLNLSTAIGWQKDKNGLEVAAFGTEKGSRWVKDCLDYYNGRNFVVSENTFDTKILPMVVNDELVKKGYKIRSVSNIEDAITYQSEDINTIAVFPDYFFSPKSYSTGELLIHHETYCIHHFAGSWLPRYVKIVLKIVNIAHSLGLGNTGIMRKILLMKKK